MFKNDLPRILFLFSLAFLAFVYGYLTHRTKIFPSKLISGAEEVSRELTAFIKGDLPWFYVRKRQSRAGVVHDASRLAPGLTLVSGIGPGGKSFASLVTSDGIPAHHWDLDSFVLWPNPTHLPASERPRRQPGTTIHGILLDPSGALTFNYERLGTMQVDFCGRPRWRLAERTHHSLYRDEDGNYWTMKIVDHLKPQARYPSLKPTFRDEVILQISPDGKVLRTISILDLLVRNDLSGLIYMSSLDNTKIRVRGDLFHGNDVEIFPSTLPSGQFHAGDVMVSLRNINTVLVFDPISLAVKTQFTGQFIRQHDPDFVDGERISVFDNRNAGERKYGAQSRIVEVSVRDGRPRPLFSGSPAQPFFTDILGKHQRLTNGNLLLTEATAGRALEVDPQGRLLWEYFNIVEPDLLGLINEAQRIPPETMSLPRIRELEKTCTL